MIILASVVEDWAAWFDAARDVLPHLPLMTVQGNHEANLQPYFAQFPMPGNHRWYSFDYGDLHFTVLNDTPLDASEISGAEKAFLEADLAATKKTWKVVAHHKPVY